MMAKDIMEGYVMLNPLVLKKFDAATFKELHAQLRKLQTTIRSEGIDLTNQEALRNRNQKLQRMHQAMSVLEFQAKLQKIILA
jgi:mRNA-degrading endonuclease RelE of RelBE toxin-antitoxin system